jgi:hypothetical protein
MPRATQAEIARQLDVIEAIVARHPGGITRAALESEFEANAGQPIQTRTLARRLAALAARGRVVPEGDSTRTTYRIGPGAVMEVPAPEEGYVPLSREGAQVRGLVRRPIAERPPVGYDDAFLTAYVPGKSWYLPKTLRERLHTLGRTPDAARPAGTYARDILGRLLIDLAWASSRLEGNTYTRLDTQNLLEFGQHAEGKDVTEAQMILNHKAAIELLVEGADEVGFNRYSLFNLHAALSENLLGDPDDEGRLRTRLVNITGTVYTPPGVPQRIEECFGLLLAKADAITDAFEQAFFVMVLLPYLQPFADVNKRTSRLAANIPLIKTNLCPLSFVDVPEQAYIEGTIGVYELKRMELLRDVFMWAYERSCAQYRVVREAIGEPDAFRLRYRTKLTEVVRETVRQEAPPSRPSLRAWAASQGVHDGDLEHFAETALSLLLGLHEGSIARYGLRPSEFTAWRSRYKATS